MSRRTRRFVMDRRQALRAMGLAGAGAMGCGLALPRLAAAQAGRSPRRVVFVLAELGWVADTLRMRPPDAPPEFGRYAGPWFADPVAMGLPDEDAYTLDLAGMGHGDLSPALAPLAGHSGRLTVLDGLGLHSAGAGSVVDAHRIGHAVAISGGAGGFDRRNNGLPSLDQRMATRLRVLEPRLTDLAALSFTVLPEMGRFGQVGPNYDFRFLDNGVGGGVPVPGETRVDAALARLAPGTVAPRYGRLKAMRTDVLDALSFEYTRIAGRVGAEDRARLELHRDLLRDLAARDAALGDSVCAVPEGVGQPNAGDAAARYEATSRSFADLIAMAFSCDIARVASIQFADPPTTLFGAGGDLDSGYAHPAGPDYQRNGVGGDRAAAVEVMTRHMQWHAQQIALLADRLAAMPEGDGTVLDHTAIVWVNEMTHGNHEFDQWPVVMVGDLGGAFRAGRYIRFAQDTPTVFGRDRQFCGVPHTRLLESLWAGMELGPIEFAARTVPGVVRTGPFEGMRRDVVLGGTLDALMA